jgi:hypothetical protein
MLLHSRELYAQLHTLFVFNATATDMLLHLVFLILLVLIYINQGKEGTAPQSKPGLQDRNPANTIDRERADKAFIPQTGAHSILSGQKRQKMRMDKWRVAGK